MRNTATTTAWDRCLRWLAPSIQAGPRFGTNDIPLDAYRQAIDDGRMRLLEGDRSAALYEFIEFPDYRAVLVAVAGGDLDELSTVLIPRAEAAGVAEGCRRAMIGGRKGWARALRHRGYVSAGATPIGWFAVKDL